MHEADWLRIYMIMELSPHLVGRLLHLSDQTLLRILGQRLPFCTRASTSRCDLLQAREATNTWLWRQVLLKQAQPQVYSSAIRASEDRRSDHGLLQI
jgi:hypothetical protein